MLRRFAWGMKKLIPLFSKKLSYPIYKILCNEWDNLTELSEAFENGNNNIKFGQGALFTGVLNCKTVLTQTTFNGLAVKENNSYSCASRKIPLENAYELSIDYISTYLLKINKLKYIFVLGDKSAFCWNKRILGLKKGNRISSNIQVLLDDWWNKKLNFNLNATKLIIKIPHPSPQNFTYEDKINEIENYLNRN